MTITPEDVARLRREATPGPWRCQDEEVVTGTGLTAKLVAGVFRRWNLETELEETAANAAFISTAHDMADLIAEQAKVIEASLGVAASLAAAISLLEGGGKKAAPSDKMFDQMLADYKQALNEWLAAYRAAREGKE